MSVHVGRSPFTPTTAAELQNPLSALKEDPCTLIQLGPHEITDQHNESPRLHSKGQSQMENSSGCSDALEEELLQDVSHTQAQHNYQDSSLMFNDCHSSQNNMEANAAWMLDSPLGPYPREAGVSRERITDDLHFQKQCFNVDRNSSSCSQSAPVKGSSTTCNPSRPAVLPGIHTGERSKTIGREKSALSLLELQNSFSKSLAHHRFNTTHPCPPVNLRHNITGRKHNFFGINCYYLHG